VTARYHDHLFGQLETDATAQAAGADTRVTDRDADRVTGRAVQATDQTITARVTAGKDLANVESVHFKLCNFGLGA
jgi:hypothetical protein